MRPVFLTAAEVAEMLGIPASSLRYWDWSGTAPVGFPVPVRIGRRVMYPAAAVRTWAENRIAAAEAGAQSG